MMTPISSTGPPIYSIGIPVEPISSPIRAIVYTEEDLDELFDDILAAFEGIPGLTWNVNNELIDVAYGM